MNYPEGKRPLNAEAGTTGYRWRRSPVRAGSSVGETRTGRAPGGECAGPRIRAAVFAEVASCALRLAPQRAGLRMKRARDCFTGLAERRPPAKSETNLVLAFALFSFCFLYSCLFIPRFLALAIDSVTWRAPHVQSS